MTPFLTYFIDNVYHKSWAVFTIPRRHSADFHLVLADGSVTAKERELWYFVLSAYGDG